MNPDKDLERQKETDSPNDLGQVGDAALKSISELIAAENGSKLLRVLETLLSEEITPMTFEDLGFATSVYIEPNALALLTWLAQPASTPPGKRIEQLDINEQGKGFLRQLISLYGPRLSRASFAARQPLPFKDDWRNFDRRILRDIRSDEVVVNLRIRKQNGESMVIEGGPASMVRFARNALQTLARIDDASALPSKDVERLRQVWEELQPSLEKPQDPPDSDD